MVAQTDPPQFETKILAAWKEKQFEPIWFDSDPVPDDFYQTNPRLVRRPVPGFHYTHLGGNLGPVLDKLPAVTQPFGLAAAWFFDPTEDDLAAFAKLDKVTHFSLHSSDYTAPKLRALASFRALTHLALSGTITDADLKELSGLTTLKVLCLRNNQITDGGVRHLTALRGLEGLDLSFTRITDTGARLLTTLKGLRALNLSGTEITDASVRALSGANLTHLRLANSAVTPASAPDIARLRGLTALTLSGDWPAAAFEQLAPLAELRVLHVGSTGQRSSALSGLSVLSKLDTLLLHRIDDEALAALWRAGKLHALTQAQARYGRPARPEDVIRLDLSGHPVTGPGLGELSALRNLDALDLRHTKVSDGLRALTGLKNLSALALSLNQFTPTGLRPLAALESLEELHLDGYLVPGAARAVATVPNLAVLSGSFSDTDLRELPALKRLRTLSTGGAGITDEGAWDIAKIK